MIISAYCNKSYMNMVSVLPSILWCCRISEGDGRVRHLQFKNNLQVCLLFIFPRWIHTGHCWLWSPQQWPLSGGPAFLFASSPRSFHKVFYVTIIKDFPVPLLCHLDKTQDFPMVSAVSTFWLGPSLYLLRFYFSQERPTSGRVLWLNPGLLELAVSFQLCHLFILFSRGSSEM